MAGKDLSKWSDSFMFKAEESNAAEGPKVYLLGGSNDPLGQIAACAKMYKGEVVRDLADVTDAERQSYLEEIQKTVLKMPLEAVQLHFMVEGVTRGFTHQMVRQRTGAYAQESTRFAVKEDMKSATALPPSLSDTVPLDTLVELDRVQRLEIGLPDVGAYASTESRRGEALQIHREQVREEALRKNDAQAARLRWDEAVDVMGDAYSAMVNTGIPAEDARGLLPTNITTRLNYITNLRSWYDTMAVRVSDQAQFEWRNVAMQMAIALRKYGEANSYPVWVGYEEIEWGSDEILKHEFADELHTRSLVRRSSAWQYLALSNELKPIEFKIGGPAFGANFDRPSRIGERVREFHKHGVPSSEWTTGSVEYGIPPLNPAEWLLDPNSARLKEGEEFDVFGDRVPKGTGLHFVESGVIGRVSFFVDTPLPEAYRWPRDFDGHTPHLRNKPGAPEMTDEERRIGREH